MFLTNFEAFTHFCLSIRIDDKFLINIFVIHLQISCDLCILSQNVIFLHFLLKCQSFTLRKTGFIKEFNFIFDYFVIYHFDLC